MSNDVPLPATEMPRPGNTVLRVVGGLVLLLPAVLAGLGGLLWPSAATIITSLQRSDLVHVAQFIGLENYSQMFQDRLFGQALSYTFSLALTRLIVVAVMPLLLATVVAQFGRGVRLAVRLLFTLPLAMFAPAAVAVIWSMVFRSVVGLPFSRLLGSADGARQTLLLLDGLYTFGLGCGVGLIVLLPALRRTPDQSALPRKPLVISWILGLLAAAALSIQSFTFSFVLTGGGPAGATAPLSVYQYQMAFEFFRFGTGAAAAALTLLALAVLGVVAGLVIVLSGLQLEMAPRVPSTSAASRSKLAVPALIVLLLLSLVLGAAVAVPLLWNLFNSLTTPAAYTDFLGKFQVGQVLANTVLPPSLAGLWQVVIAYLAALGIGAVRPFGRWSEWLLLPVCPWLFITVGPLSLAAFQNLRGFGLLGTMLGLIPPLPLSVPMVFVLTLFFKGQASARRAAQAGGKSGSGSFLTQLVLPSLPLAVLLYVVALLVGFQDLLWPALAGTSAATRTMVTTFLLLHAGGGISGQPMLSAAITLFELPLSIAFFLVLGIVQILFLDRLALTTSR